MVPVTLATILPHWLHTILDWPMSTTGGYNFLSGLGVGWIVGLTIYLRHCNCDAPWCLRIGRHHTTDRQHKLCRRHHPDLPDHKLSLAEIHARQRPAIPRTHMQAGARHNKEDDQCG